MFGKLSFIEANEYEPSYLFGAKDFQPLNSKIEYQFYNDNKIVTQEQKEWVISIESKYSYLEVEIENFINDELTKMNDKITKYSLKKDLTIEFITIPKLLDPVVEWSLTYGVNKDFLFLTVEFRDWKPNFLSISA